MSARTLFSRFETSQASYVYDTSTNAILGVPRQLWEQLGTVERDASQQPAANEAVTALQAEGYLQPCEVRTMQFYSPEMPVSGSAVRVLDHCAHQSETQERLATPERDRRSRGGRHLSRAQPTGCESASSMPYCETRSLS